MNRILRSVYFWEALSFTVAGIGSLAMSESSSMLWYANLSRSSLTPPNIAFPVVWTVLYAMMGYSAYRVARLGALQAVLPYILQLIFNLAWTWLFFYFKQPTVALADFFLLISSLIWTIAIFSKYDVTSALLLIPYLLWGLFAFWLNLFIVLYN